MSLIAGKFGCGKTLLLLALLGEARLVDGKISYLLSHILDPSDTSIPDWTMRKDGVAYVPQVRQASRWTRKAAEP
jgi:ABC-type branched-subunit amino acid transport system ATPase component